MIELRGITWDHERGWGGVRAAADAYREHEPDVHVTWEARSLQSFADQPVADLAGFDLIVLDHPSIGAAVARGALIPLDDHLDASILEAQRAASVGASFESYAWEGHQWALAIDAAAQVAAYRADLLDGAPVPQTWDDVLALAQDLRDVGRRIAMPAIPVDAICAFLGICNALGATPFTDVVVDREIGRRASATLRAVIDMAHPGSLEWNPPRVLAHMREHDDVVYCPLAFGYVNFARAGGSRLAFAPGPALSGTLGGAGIAVSSASRYAAEAAAFAAFVTSSEIQRGVYLAGGGQPGHRDAWTDPRIDHDANGFFSATLEALDVAYLRPRYEGFLEFQARAGELVHAHLAGGGDPDDMLDRIEDAYRSVGAPR
jgi:multiple sugar transport system substrate-binding protein